MGEVAKTEAAERPWLREGLISYQLHENGLSVAFKIHDRQDDDEEVNGYVKWDGCVNWMTSSGDEEASYYHFCGKEDLVHFAEQLFTAVCIAQQLMGDKVDQCFESGWGRDQ